MEGRGSHFYTQDEGERKTKKKANPALSNCFGMAECGLTRSKVTTVVKKSKMPGKN